MCSVVFVHEGLGEHCMPSVVYLKERSLSDGLEMLLTRPANESKAINQLLERVGIRNQNKTFVLSGIYLRSTTGKRFCLALFPPNIVFSVA